MVLLLLLAVFILPGEETFQTHIHTYASAALQLASTQPAVSCTSGSAGSHPARLHLFTRRFERRGRLEQGWPHRQTAELIVVMLGEMKLLYSHVNQERMRTVKR